jgi:chromosome segregation ATPase
MLKENAEKIHNLQTKLNNLPLFQDSIMERERQVKSLQKDVEIVSAKNVQAEQVVSAKTGLCFRLEGDVRDRDSTIKELNGNIDVLNKCTKEFKETISGLNDEIKAIESKIVVDATEKIVESTMMQTVRVLANLIAIGFGDPRNGS